MSKIIIEKHNDELVHVDLSRVSEEMTDQECMGVMIQAYIETARSIIKAHICDDPDCCAKALNQEIIDAVEETIKIHNLKHKHHDKH